MEEKNYINSERYRHASDYWWLMLILGIAVIVVGFLVFMRPGESYAGLSLAFGLLILASGILQLFLGTNTARHHGRGWLIAGGVIEIVIGLILMFNPMISAAILPYFLGFWMLFRGFSMIGIASDMRAMNIGGTGWTIALAILLIIFAFVVILFPAIGVGAIIIWLGFAFLMTGAAMVAFSLRLQSLRRYWKN